MVESPSPERVAEERAAAFLMRMSAEEAVVALDDVVTSAGPGTAREWFAHMARRSGLDEVAYSNPPSDAERILRAAVDIANDPHRPPLTVDAATADAITTGPPLTEGLGDFQARLDDRDWAISEVVGEEFGRGGQQSQPAARLSLAVSNLTQIATERDLQRTGTTVQPDQQTRDTAAGLTKLAGQIEERWSTGLHRDVEATQQEVDWLSTPYKATSTTTILSSVTVSAATMAAAIANPPTSPRGYLVAAAVQAALFVSQTFANRDWNRATAARDDAKHALERGMQVLGPAREDATTGPSTAPSARPAHLTRTPGGPQPGPQRSG